MFWNAKRELEILLCFRCGKASERTGAQRSRWGLLPEPKTRSEKVYLHSFLVDKQKNNRKP